MMVESLRRAHSQFDAENERLGGFVESSTGFHSDGGTDIDSFTQQKKFASFTLYCSGEPPNRVRITAETKFRDEHVTWETLLLVFSPPGTSRLFDGVV